MKTKALLIFFSIFISLNAQTTYYFSTSGSDANSGTSSSSPKKSLSALQTLLDSSQPGDKFLLKRGDTWTTRAGTSGLSITTCKGTSSNYIVIADYGTGDKPKFDFSGTASAISITGGSESARPYFIKIQNLHITSSNQTSFPKQGVYIGTSGDTATSPKDIIMDNLIVENFRDGIRCAGPLKNITIQNCLIQNHTVTGIFLGSYNSIIRNNRIDNIGGGDDYTKGIYMSDAVNGLIENNEISNCEGSGGILLANGYNVTIRGNILYNNPYENLQMGDRNSGLASLDSILIEGNTLYNSMRMIEIHPTSTYAGNGTSRVYIRNNILYNASYYGIYNSLPDFSNSYIVNNTFYNCLDAVKIGGGITNLTIKNNIFYNDLYSSGTLINFVNGTTVFNNTNLDYNLYYAAVGGDIRIGGIEKILSQFKSAYPNKEQNGLSTNPSFVNPKNFDFHLESNSQAINNGVNLSSIVSDDFERNPRPLGNTHDIGSFESNSSGGSSGGTLPINLNIKVFLEGPFNNGSMLPLLHQQGNPLNQNFSSAPWNYNGNESVSSIPNDIVDWVLLELRTGTAASTTVTHKAAFLKNDGFVVDMDGISKPSFGELSSGDYYLVIRHRNHLDIMSASPVTLSSNSLLYDFTTGPDKTYGNDPLSNLGNGIWGMFAGDGDYNGIINVIDYGSVGNFLFQTGYKSGDLDMNGVINVLDYSKTNSNLFRNSQVPN